MWTVLRCLFSENPSVFHQVLKTILLPDPKTQSGSVYAFFVALRPQFMQSQQQKTQKRWETTVFSFQDRKDILKTKALAYEG